MWGEKSIHLADIAEVVEAVQSGAGGREADPNG